ncbi:MAG: mechanosensitive ion channel family protein [Clostridiales bacterium]|nr:mechanosensitive ion channel family protein [Clostridiales bacterium]MCD8134025.1 mechanosensitive ion channel family protein [Clostridiales bacterium]
MSVYADGTIYESEISMFSVFTGILSENVADTITEVISDNVEVVTWDVLVEYFHDSLPTILDFLVKLIIAIIVLLVGRRIIRFVRKCFCRFLDKTNLDTGLKQFFDKFVGVALHFVLILIVLGHFGITASSVIAIIGSAGLSIGLALQGTLSNFAGGVLILMLRPFKVGDYIKEDTSGNEGRVQEIQLFYTKLVTLDNKVVIVPNANLTSSSLTNMTNQDRRRVDIKVGISYSADIREAKRVIETVLAGEQKRIEDEPYKIYVDELADSSVVIGTMTWVRTEDYYEVKWRLTENIKYALDENNIEIPFPQVTVTYAQQGENQ